MPTRAQTERVQLIPELMSWARPSKILFPSSEGTHLEGSVPATPNAHPTVSPAHVVTHPRVRHGCEPIRYYCAEGTRLWQQPEGEYPTVYLSILPR